MTSTPISQLQWVKVMGENPSAFKEGPNAIIKEINGHMVSMQPDNPVENISWCSILVFANRLSTMRELTPAYDLNGLEMEGRAEDGTLSCQGNLKINSPDGNIYSAEGYRLPTSAEWVFMARGRGTIDSKYHFGNNERLLPRYAWFVENSNNTT